MLARLDVKAMKALKPLANCKMGKVWAGYDPQSISFAMTKVFCTMPRAGSVAVLQFRLIPPLNQASDGARQRGMLFAHAEVFWLEQGDCLWRV